MVVTLQAYLHDRRPRRMLQALGLALAVVLMLFLFTPAFAPAPYQLEEAVIELVRIPEPIELPPPPLTEIPLPSLPGVIIPVDDETLPTLLDDVFDFDTPPVRIKDIRHTTAPAVLQLSPRVLHRVAPRYPDLAREAELAGVVNLELTLDERGNVVAVRALDARAPTLLIEAAMEAARRWRFEPAWQHRTPVPSRVHLSFRFAIR